MVDGCCQATMTLEVQHVDSLLNDTRILWMLNNAFFLSLNYVRNLTRNILRHR